VAIAPAYTCLWEELRLLFLSSLFAPTACAVQRYLRLPSDPLATHAVLKENWCI